MQTYKSPTIGLSGY